MKYLLTRWMHNFPDMPFLIYSEFGESGFETRKVEVFKDGSKGFAGQSESFGSTFLAIEPLPSISEIPQDDELQVKEITKEEFEQVWSARLTK